MAINHRGSKGVESFNHKPDSVTKGLQQTLSPTTIHLGAQLLAPSSGLPGSFRLAALKRFPI